MENNPSIWTLMPSRLTMRPWALLLCLGTLLLLPGRLAGHAFQPAVLVLREDARGRVEVRLQEAPSGAESDGAPEIAPGLPAWCKPVGQGGPRRWVLACGPRGLSGATVTISAPPGQARAEGGGEALVHVVRRDGSTRSGVVRPGQGGLLIPASEDGALAPPVSGYFALGVGHLLSGLDHLLFVLALLLCCAAAPGAGGALRRLLWTVSAFTVAHSLTLTLAVLGVLRVPAVPAEACIALSLVFTAGAICRGRGAGSPAWLAFGFGLLHGLGFAGALAETGLPRGQLGPALLLFNLGIEAGQLLFVGLLLGAAWAFGRRPFSVLALAGAQRPLAYVVGVTGALFFWQRLALFFP
jgi:hypothetical protein